MAANDYPVVRLAKADGTITDPGGGAANAFPGSDYATAPRQDTGNTSLSAIATGIGALADAAPASDAASGSLIAKLTRALATLTGLSALMTAVRDRLPVDATIPAGSPFTLASGAASGAVVGTPWDSTGAGSVDLWVTAYGGAPLFLQEQASDGSNNWETLPLTINNNLTNSQAKVYNNIYTTGLWRASVGGKTLRLVTVGATSAVTKVAVVNKAAPWSAPSQYIEGGSLGLNAGSNVIGYTTLRSTGTARSAPVGTTAVPLMAANANRQGWKIKNDSAGDIWINFDATATAAAGGGNIKIPAGGYLASEPGFVETGAMSAIGSAAGLAITAREH